MIWPCVYHRREGPLRDFLTWEEERGREKERERESGGRRGRADGAW